MSIVDNLTTTNASAALSATQGKLLKEDLESLKSSVSNGKALVASAITDKGVTTAADATFQQMADNINNINIGGAYGHIRYPIYNDADLFNKHPVGQYCSISGAYDLSGSATHVRIYTIDNAIIGLGYNVNDNYYIDYVAVLDNGDIYKSSLNLGFRDPGNSAYISVYSDNKFAVKGNNYWSSGTYTYTYELDTSTGIIRSSTIGSGSPTNEPAVGFNVTTYNKRLYNSAYWLNVIRITNDYNITSDLAFLSYANPDDSDYTMFSCNSRLLVYGAAKAIPLTVDSHLAYYANLNIGSGIGNIIDTKIVKIVEHTDDALILEIQPMLFTLPPQ